MVSRSRRWVAPAVVATGLIIVVAWSAFPRGWATEGKAEKSTPWQRLDEGLSLGILDSPRASTDGDSKVTVLRIDPDRYDLKLLSVAELGGEKRTAKAWSEEFHLIAAVNAGMYQRDGKTSVGYMRNGDAVLNKKIGGGMQAMLAFGRVDDTVPRTQIIDRSCQNLDKLKNKYRTLIQGIRMIGCGRKNVWKRKDSPWSMVVIGVDRAGQVLFVFTSSPYSPKEFIDILLGLPLELERAMYLEGGPEASLFLSTPEVTLERFGTHGTGLGGLFENQGSWPIPQVIGVVKR